jgi:glucan phosphoethanolaminetransferase (alkaline phosphatase superfamily)
MSAALRPAHLYLLLTYLLLTAVPFVPFLPRLQGRSLADPWQVAGMAVVGWMAAWAIFKRPARFHWLLLPAFLALPVELYLFVYYGQGISTHHLGILAETSPVEALEFLGSTVWLLAALALAVVAWFVSTWKVARATRAFDWDDASRPVALAMLAALALLWGYGQQFGVGTDKGRDSALPALPRWAALPFEVEAFSRSWPFGLGARGIDFYKERVHLARLAERSAAFRFGARQAAPDGAPETVVMVIGESSRYDRWQLNGYARPTNPLLAKESNLVRLADIITPVSATRLSVPVIVSRKTAMQSLRDGFAEKSFLTAYKEAGFKTFWLSNQISFGKFDTPVSVFAKEADVVAYLNLGGFTHTSNLDEVLLPALAASLRDPAPKKLIVLHTLGSHWNYSQRYPERFDQWKPSLHGVHKPVVTDTRIRHRLSNSYDSTILYTDWFLANVIGALKYTDARSAMMYVADHGQTLYDNSCKLAFHGHNTQFEFHVPGLVWYSDRYAARYPDKVARLAANSGARLSTENVFHTLLDLGDIRYPGERLQRSFVNPAFAPHKRYVDSYGWTDYDNATLRGDCREVIDKGRPLKRSG